MHWHWDITFKEDNNKIIAKYITLGIIVYIQIGLI